MKGFFLDENLPSKIQFTPGLPVIPRTALPAGATDTQVWEFARKNRLAIVSKDADFSARIIVDTPPPWVVRLRFGNLRRREFHVLLARLWPQVELMLKTHKLVNVYASRVEGIH